MISHAYYAHLGTSTQHHTRGQCPALLLSPQPASPVKPASSRVISSQALGMAWAGEREPVWLAWASVAGLKDPRRPRLIGHQAATAQRGKGARVGVIGFHLPCWEINKQTRSLEWGGGGQGVV